LFQVIQNCVLGILRRLDTSKQKESYEEKKFGSMDFIGIEKITFETIDIRPLNLNVMQGKITRQKISICDCNL
jgi:hypothetical protein